MWLVSDATLKLIKYRLEEILEFVEQEGEPIRYGVFTMHMATDTQTIRIPKRAMWPSFGENGLEFNPVEFTDAPEGGKRVCQKGKTHTSINITGMCIFTKTDDPDKDVLSMFDGKQHLIVQFDDGQFGVLKNVMYTGRGKVFEGLKDDETKKPIWRFEDVSLLAAEYEHLGCVQLYIVRLWDGMDGVWMDVSEPVFRGEAEEVYNEKTKGGTQKVCWDDIDYYKIFPTNTVMRFSYEAGCDGMFRR